MARMSPGPADRILHIGVSDVVNDAANLIERLNPVPGRVPDHRERPME
jgi:hypothetical protein